MEPRNYGADQARSGPDDPQPRFDINIKPYKRNSYDFTDNELNGLEDMKIDIRRHLELDVTKNDLIRGAIHEMMEDFDRRGAESAVFRRLRKKLPR